MENYIKKDLKNISIWWGINIGIKRNGIDKSLRLRIGSHPYNDQFFKIIANT